jgi:hypothetical protein
MHTRRSFLKNLTLLGLGAGFFAQAARAADAPAKIEESDTLADALGYKHDTTKVSAKKFPKHKDDQICAECAYYTGKPGEDWGPCAAVGGKLVASKGWCSAYVKKL